MGSTFLAWNWHFPKVTYRNLNYKETASLTLSKHAKMLGNLTLNIKLLCINTVLPLPLPQTYTRIRFWIFKIGGVRGGPPFFVCFIIKIAGESFAIHVPRACVNLFVWQSPRKKARQKTIMIIYIHPSILLNLTIDQLMFSIVKFKEKVLKWSYNIIFLEKFEE